MESSIVTDDAEKLLENLVEVGAESVQFRAQQSRASVASADLSLLFALSQHLIMSIFSECKGIPATTPPASAKRRNTDVSHLFISILTIFDASTGCQQLYSAERPILFRMIIQWQSSHALPCNASMPSFAIIGSIMSPATGSAHHQPKIALRTKPTRRIAERYAHRSD